ncbi:MAG: hypothetical protein JW731_03600 [Bacteroidales bacterium]|nr:hypothetical protein [Bacteroidales bacterium]
MKGLIIHCREASELAVKQGLEPLKLWDRIRLFLHLSMCGFCRIFAKQNSFIDRHLKNLDENVITKMDTERKEKFLSDILE